MIRSLFGAILIAGVIVSVACRNTMYPQEVLKYPDSTGTFPARWERAHQDASVRSFRGYWIGYSIKKMMGEHTFVGSYNSDPKKNKPTLREVIYGGGEENMKISGLKDFEGEFQGLFSFDDDNRHEKETVKELGILIHFGDPKSRRIDETRMSNLSLHVDLMGDPLLWIGGTTDDESVDLLKSLYEQKPVPEVQKKIITVVGMHPPTEKVFKFLRSILLGSEINSLRNEATFGIGQLNSDEAVSLLERRSQDDPAEDVREQSVFCLSGMKNAGAIESLIRLARGAKEEELQKKAIFWIGQIATVKITATRDRTGKEYQNTDIKKKVIFALSQLPDQNGVDPLIKIAETNGNIEVRKEAVFWLSQSDDPRALDALIDIVKN